MRLASASSACVMQCARYRPAYSKRVLNLVAHPKETTWTEDVREQGADDRQYVNLSVQR